MIVTMEAGLRMRLIDYCRRLYPAEACGFVIGDVDAVSGCMTASDFVPVRNVAAVPEQQFVMDPAELVVRLAETPSPRLLGIFHSHPRSPAVPSEADLQTEWHTLPSYWIVSLQHAGNPSIGVFRLERLGEDIVPFALAVR